MKHLRVAVIGLGDMGLRHAKAWQNLSNTTEGAINGELVALVDDVPSRLQEAQAMFGLSSNALFSDAHTAIATTRPDVVSVCIPTAFHAQVGLVAIEYGAHVLIEKPLALTLEQCDSVISAAEKQGVVLAVGFMLRYSPAVKQIRSWLEAGKLGNSPLLYTAEDIMSTRPKTVMHAKNINGGPIVDYWCHHFDLWSYFFDSQPVAVAGFGATLATGKPEVAKISELAVDTASIAVHYANGCIGQFSTSWGLPRGLSVGNLEADRLIGANGIILGNIRHEMKLHAISAIGQEEILTANNHNVAFWQDEITQLAYTITQGGQPVAGGLEGKNALAVSLAALQAIESKQMVYL